MSCRVKQEEILQSAETSRESLQGRVREQEVSLEQGFDALDINLQVGTAMQSLHMHLIASSYSKSIATADLCVSSGPNAGENVIGLCSLSY